MKKIIGTLIVSATLLTTGISAQAAPPKKELQAYLTSINMTEAQLESILKQYGDSIKYYDSVAELKGRLGEPLTQKNLGKLLSKYNYTEAQVRELAIFYDDMDENASLLDSYHFVGQIEDLIDLDQEAVFPTIDEITEMLTYYQFSDREANKISGYLTQVMIDDPSTEAKLQVLAKRLVASERRALSLDSEELSPELLAEMVNIIKEVQSTLKIDIKVSLEYKNGVVKPVTYADLLKMGNGLEDLDTVNRIHIAIYDLKGTLLGDTIFDLNDFFEDGFFDDFEDTMNKIANSKTPVRTENGGELPKTANHNTESVIVGLLMMSGALVLRKKAKVKQN